MTPSRTFRVSASVMGLQARLRQGPARGLLALVAGSTGGQVLALAIAPLLARLYSPASFGVFAYVSAVSAVLVTVACLKFEAAVPLEASLNTARALMRLAVTSLLVAAVATTGIAFALQGSLSDAVGFASMPWFLWLGPSILLSGLFVLLTQASIRKRAYSQVAGRGVLQTAGVYSSQLVAAALTRSPHGLLGGQAIGRLVGIAALARANRDLLRRPEAGAYRRAWREHWRFPVVFAPSAILNALGTQLPLLLIGAWFGLQAAGALGLAQRVIMLPAALIGTAVGQVFAGELAERLRRGVDNNHQLYLKVSRRLFALGTLVALLIFFAAPPLFPRLMGNEWRDAGLFAQAAAASVGLGFAVSPVSIVYIAYRRTISSLMVDISRVVTILILAYVAHSRRVTPVEAAWIIYTGQFLNYAVTWLYGLRIVSSGRANGVSLRNWARSDIQSRID